MTVGGGGGGAGAGGGGFWNFFGSVLIQLHWHNLLDTNSFLVVW